MWFVFNMFTKVLLFCPGRQALARLGTWLLKLSEVPEIRRVNWDRQLRIKAEPYGESGKCFYFRLSEPVTDDKYLTFDTPRAQLSKQTLLVKALFKIQGVNFIQLSAYSVLVYWSPVFSSHEMIPQIEQAIRENIAM